MHVIVVMFLTKLRKIGYAADFCHELGRLLAHATSYFEELDSAKRTKKAPATRFAKKKATT